MERQSTSEKFPFGSQMPAFELSNVDGKRIKVPEYFKGARAAMVFFSCNHCPYVKGSEMQLIDVVRKFEKNGLKTLSISSNDAVQYPDDSFEKMKEKASSMNLPYPYLFDETQSVAKLFDAACTPEFYLFDSGMKLVYHGTINDSPRDPAKVTREYLSGAITSVIEGITPNPQYIHPVGCSIKWKA